MIIITNIQMGQFDRLLDQAVSGLWNKALRPAMLPRDPTSAAIGNTKPTKRNRFMQLHRHAGLKNFPLQLHPEWVYSM